METVLTEIESAIKRLGLPSSAIRVLPEEDGRSVYLDALNHFVASGDRRRWWEDFRQESTSYEFPGDDGWLQIPKLVPDPDEKVWFIVEEDALPFYPVYETSPRVACDIIGNCYAYEYYLVHKLKQWLLCETHHGVIYAVGKGIQERLHGIMA